ncbi:MAG: hypothetical protein HZB19_10305 [Chloroflexi bacterium]|nr:hypothetical protein [Chloroflexota bacterium]
MDTNLQARVMQAFDRVLEHLWIQVGLPHTIRFHLATASKCPLTDIR